MPSTSGRGRAELHYGKVDGESPGVLTGIMLNKMYLYGTKFDVIVDHEPLVSLYRSHSRALPVRVANTRAS